MSVDISPNFPPRSSWTAAASLAEGFFGLGSSIGSRSIFSIMLFGFSRTCKHAGGKSMCRCVSVAEIISQFKWRRYDALTAMQLIIHARASPVHTAFVIQEECGLGAHLRAVA